MSLIATMKQSLSPRAHLLEQTQAAWIGFAGAVLGVLLAGTILIIVHAFIIPKAERHQRNLDRMYDASFKVGRISALYYAHVWNGWYARRDSQPGGEILEELQQLGGDAYGLSLHLALLFGDQIASDWLEIKDRYQEISYPAFHSQESLPTEESMNASINPVVDSISILLQKIRIKVEAESRRLW